MPDATAPTPPWTRSDYATLALAFVAATVVTWGLHEGAHWLTGEALGYTMWIRLNQVGLVDGTYASDLHQGLVAMAGPVATWIQAFVALVVLRRTHARWSYAFLFLALWMRAVAMGISLVAHPNDEARVSLLLGVPVWVVPALSVLLLLGLTVAGSRTLRVGWKGNAVSYAMASAMTALVVVLDQLLF